MYPFGRSPIHGRGLFCKKNIDAGEMVIEYSGNVIRSVLTDKREKYYDGKVRTNELPSLNFILSTGSTTILLKHSLVVSFLKGDWLLHVSYWWLRGGRCHGARQRCPLHQPLLWAQLLFSGHHRQGPETHRHLFLSPHILWRGAHLRLQVPYWGRQQQAALQLRCKEVSQVPQLISEHFKEDCRSVEQQYQCSEDDPTEGLSSHCLSVNFLGPVIQDQSCQQYTSSDGVSAAGVGRTLRSEGRELCSMCRKTILEEGPFVEIPTYCASFCLIYMWHGKFHL